MQHCRAKLNQIAMFTRISMSYAFVSCWTTSTCRGATLRSSHCLTPSAVCLALPAPALARLTASRARLGNSSMVRSTHALSRLRTWYLDADKLWADVHATYLRKWMSVRAARFRRANLLVCSTIRNDASANKELKICSGPNTLPSVWRQL